MNYTKPTVVNLSFALEAVQTQQLDKTSLYIEVQVPGSPRQSAGAYEADE